KNQDFFAGRDARFAHRFQARVHRLDESGVFECRVRRQCDHPAFDDPWHRANVLGEAAAIGVETCRQPDFLVSRALREKFPLAVEAVAARNVVEADDAIAGLELRYAAADLNDGSRKLVPQNLRRLNESVVNLLDVRSANAACRHAEQDFALANLRNRNGLDNHAALAAVDAGAHVPRMFPLGLVRSGLGGCMAHWPAVAVLVSRALARSISIGT